MTKPTPKPDGEKTIKQPKLYWPDLTFPPINLWSLWKTEPRKTKNGNKNK